jgi:hypothetical protein
MSHRLRVFALALAFFCIPLTACETKRVWVELPAFGDGAVDGVWLWRLAETGEWQRHCHLPLGDAELAADGEAVAYDQECGDRDLGFDLRATVERDPEDPETVRLGLWYVRWEDPGTYRLSSHGDAGESPLSETTLDL